MKNKIFHIGLNINKGFSGRAIQISTLIQKLEKNEHEIISITGSANGKSQRIKRLLESYYILRLLLRKKSVVIFHGWWIGCILIPLLSCRHKVIFQSTFKNYDDYKSMKNGVKSLALQGLDYFIEQEVPNNFNTSKLMKIIYLPNICKIYKRTRHHSIDKCIHSGVISSRKNQIGAIEYFLNNNINMNLDFYGPKNNNYDSTLSYIQQFETHITKCKFFDYKGEYNHSEINTLLDSYTHFCVASLQEGMSNFYLECLSKGLEPMFIPDADVRLFNSYDYKNKNNFKFVFHDYPIEIWKRLIV
jgi:hypothetical protein